MVTTVGAASEIAAEATPEDSAETKDSPVDATLAAEVVLVETTPGQVKPAKATALPEVVAVDSAPHGRRADIEAASDISAVHDNGAFQQPVVKQEQQEQQPCSSDAGPQETAGGSESRREPLPVLQFASKLRRRASELGGAARGVIVSEVKTIAADVKDLAEGIREGAQFTAQDTLELRDKLKDRAPSGGLRGLLGGSAASTASTPAGEAAGQGTATTAATASSQSGGHWGQRFLVGGPSAGKLQAVLVDSAHAKDSSVHATVAAEAPPMETMETAQAKESLLDTASAAAVAPAGVISAEMKHGDVEPAEAPELDVTQASDSAVDTMPAAEETPVEVAPEETRLAEAAQALPAAERAPEEVVPLVTTPAEAPQAPPPTAERAPKNVVPPQKESAEAASLTEEYLARRAKALQLLDDNINFLLAPGAGRSTSFARGTPLLMPGKEFLQPTTSEGGDDHEVPEVTKAGPICEPPKACIETESMEDSKALRGWTASVDPADAGALGAKLLGEDSSGRDVLIKMLKDQCLAFLSEQLPLLKIPQIHGVEDGLEYTINNVDLSSFKINADCLTVELAPSAENSTRHDGGLILHMESLVATEKSAVSGERKKPEVQEQDALRATAADLCVVVPQLKWSYQQKGFPYLHGLGTARGCLSGGSVTLAFQFHWADVDGEVVPQLGLSSCSVFIDSLTVDVNESVLSWVYNRLAFLFQDTIRQYIASSLQAALSDNVASLLASVNPKLSLHWPPPLSAIDFAAEALPLAGDAAKSAAPREEGDARNHAGG